MSIRSPKNWLVLLLVTLSAPLARAGDINWSGLYRFEGISTQNLELGGAQQSSTYGLTHLILRPSIVAADGLVIHSRFDIFNSPAYPNSQVGQVLGAGPRGPTGFSNTQTSSARDSNVMSNVESSDTIAVNELYLTWSSEFGSLIVGRVPLQFGLGMSYSAGNGDFDHWFDNRDMVGYKMVFGNMYVLPMYGLMEKGMQNGLQSGTYDYNTGGDLANSDDVTDYMVQFGYDNAESGINLGVFFLTRVASGNATDTPTGPNTNGEIGGPYGSNNADAEYKNTQWNVFFAREFSEFKFGIEAGFENGTLGVKTANTPGASVVGLSAFGFATEFAYKPTSSKNTWSLKTGVASGDQAGTDDRFEGFYFNRNYDVADLMFNRVLGADDFLRTQPLRGDYYTNGRTLTGSQVVDVETLSNAFYISPSFAHKYSDSFAMDTRLTYALLHSGPFKDTDIAKDLGYELDIAGTYKPYDRLTWRSGLSFLLPGQAFVGGDRNYDHNFAWGMYTKAAIRF
jgi:hypothetical protein